MAATMGMVACETFGNAKEQEYTAQMRLDGLPEATTIWELPPELREVSAIALLSDNLMACVQDEEGAIYLYDLNQKVVKEKIRFSGPGDYEGIAINGNTAYVLRSDGSIYEIADLRSGKPEVTEHKSVLASTQDTEGLAFDAKNNRLLISCKGYDKKLGENKGIYAFSLENKQMQAAPVITIPLTQEHLKANGKKKKNKYDVLQPSSLEIHPITGEFYLLDAANNRLMILDEQGKIQKAQDLDKDQLRQAEGLTFGSKGEMYISSEGSKKGKGLIVKYEQGIVK